MSSHTAATELTFLGKLVLEGEIVCQTGLHIGAGKGSLEIGGADNPVVKDAFGIPYIPGSSLRGRLRSLLEQTLGLAVPSELVYLVEAQRPGSPDPSERPAGRRNLHSVRAHSRPRGAGDGESDRNGAAATPARLTVYDAPLVVDSITPQMRENLDDELTEVKSENAVDRITSQANPRTLERVPAGARFRFRMVLDVLCAGRQAAAGARGGRFAAAGRRCAGRRRKPWQRAGCVHRFESDLAQQRLLRQGRRRNQPAFGRGSGGTAATGQRRRFRREARLRHAAGSLDSPAALGSMAISVPETAGMTASIRCIGATACSPPSRMAMRQLGLLDEWLEATARAPGRRSLRSRRCFRFRADTLFVTPPATLWPPPPVAADCAESGIPGEDSLEDGAISFR